MKIRPYLIGAGVGALGLALLPLTGLLPQGVSGVGKITEAYQWLANRQSVTMSSVAIRPPDLENPAMARRAAGHYELVCAACHGSPDAAPARFAHDLQPVPPPLAGAQRWRADARVFQTLKAGVAHSAMPAWPSQIRDDEIWDMVAFLRILPDLSAQQYRAIAGRGQCVDCHSQGENADDTPAGIPRLDLQSPEYIAAALKSYRAGQRQSGVMMAAAHRLNDAQIAELAAFFGKSTPAPPKASPPPALLSQGLPARDVPACLACHGPEARADYPRLIGQDHSYLTQQMGLFADHGASRGGPHAKTMALAIKNLPQSEIDAVITWLSQPTAPP